jgi:hypothetical protein
MSTRDRTTALRDPHSTGASYGAGTQSVEDLVKKLAKDYKLKQKHLNVRGIFISVERGIKCRNLPALADACEH